MGFITDQIGGLIATGLENVGAAAWAQGLINDGIWAGLSGVLSFIPQILVLFLFISILEDSGYMARVAFILDRAFRKFGLSGRAFIPMIMGFGCSVPAAVNTRTLADEKERIMTNRVIPFFTCGAKAPILAAVCGAIAAQYTGRQRRFAGVRAVRVRHGDGGHHGRVHAADLHARRGRTLHHGAPRLPRAAVP